MARQIGDRVTQRGKLPIENGEDARLGWMQDDIVEPVVAVDESHLISRQMIWKPCRKGFHRRNALGGHLAIVARPAGDLAGQVALWPSVVGKAQARGIECVQPRQRSVQAVVYGGTLGGVEARQAEVPEQPAIHEAHDIEGAANHGAVRAQVQSVGNRHTAAPQGAQDPILAVDGVPSMFGHAARAPTQDVAAIGRLEQIGGVGLPPSELADSSQLPESVEAVAQVGVERGSVDVALAHACGTRKPGGSHGFLHEAPFLRS